MTDEFLLRLLERVHGHLAWLSIVALVHPVVMLRRAGRRMVASVLLTTVLVSVTFGLGLAIYPAYRTLVRPDLFRSHAALGWWFERKEHLAVGVLGFTWLGLVLHLAQPRFPPAEQARLTVLTGRVFGLALAFALIAGTTGLIVASTVSF